MDMDGYRLTNGGGTTIYGSNHGVVYAPGGLGVLAGNSSRRDILYFHYCMSLFRAALMDADGSVNTTIGWADKVSMARIMGMGILIQRSRMRNWAGPTLTTLMDGLLQS